MLYDYKSKFRVEIPNRKAKGKETRKKKHGSNCISYKQRCLSMATHEALENNLVDLERKKQGKEVGDEEEMNIANLKGQQTIKGFRKK
jgi:hypothetical protein